MALDEISRLIPDYANDLKLNLSGIFIQTELNKAQLWGTLVACAMVCGNKTVIREVEKEASGQLDPVVLTAARSAAGLMAMNNVFYRFQHLTANEKYRTMPARLRMNAIRNHGADPADFELWCLAVSAVNACGRCVDSHEKILREKGVNEETILASVRVASIVRAVSTVLSAGSNAG